MAPADVPAPPVGREPEPASEDLLQLEQLRDEGMLSPEQFEAAKAQLRST